MMDQLGHKDVVSSARTALNSALRRGREQGSKVMRKRIMLSATDLKKRLTVIKARGGSLKSVQGALVFSGTPIGMINFVVGNKSPIKQKGIKIKKRRKLKARIKPGKTIRLSGSFVQDIKSKQVFRHIKSGRKARKVSTKSLAKMLVEQNIQKMFDEIVQKRFDRVFRKQLQWRWDKTSRKYSKSPMRLPR